MENADLEKFLPKSESQFIYSFSCTSDDVYWVTASLIILFILNMILGYFSINWIVGRFNK